MTPSYESILAENMMGLFSLRTCNPFLVYVQVLGARGAPCQVQLCLFMLQDWAPGVFHVMIICVYLCCRIGR